jgi:hypothetical protein
LNGFVDNFTFDDVSDYISQELYKFDINRWNLVFFSSWKNTIQTNLLAIRNEFNSSDDLVNEVKDQYENIAKLPDDLIAILVNKKSNIDDLEENIDGE